jgi:hypothetical protein
VQYLHNQFIVYRYLALLASRQVLWSKTWIYQTTMKNYMIVRFDT